jgi:site-specific DNA recombinase
VFPLDVAVYTRISTKQEEQYSSLQIQEEHYLEYCNNNGYNLVKLYTDEGLSATSTKRKGFLDLLYDAGLDYEKDKDTNEILYFKESDREPKFNMIILKDVSRFSRNVDSITIARKLKNKGVFILFENAGFSTIGNDSEWEMRLSLLLTFSQQESLDRSKKVSFSYLHNSKKGVWHFARNLYGYNYDKETKKVSVVENQADIVRKIFDLFINEKLGVKSISNYLNKNNFKTQTGKGWTPTNVRRTLRNEKYIGRVILNRYTNNGITSGKKRIERSKDQWVIFEGINPDTNKPYIEPIIDIDTWEKAQQIIDQRVDKSKVGTLAGSNKVKNIFYNKLFCGCCGKPFVRISVTKKRKTHTFKDNFYMCSDRRKRSACDNKSISHNVLVRKITEFAENNLYKELDFKRKLFEKNLNIEKMLLQSQLKMSNKIIDNANNRIKEIDSEKNKLINAFLKGNSSIATVIEEKIAELENEKNELNKKILANDKITIENKINEIDDGLKILKTAIKEIYTFDEALKYIGKIIYTNGEFKFHVVADEKIEPLLRIDVSKIDESNLDKMIDQTKEMNDIMKNIKSLFKK